MTDKLIHSFRQGNQKAYQNIFRELYPVMCSFANKYVKSDDDAEDITQEIFIELWNQRKKFTTADQLKAFLYLSVKNKCLNFLKHNKIKEKYLKSFNGNEDIFFRDYLIETEVISEIKRVIDCLSRQRKKIILLVLKGLKNKEIAENLKISVNTVKMQKKIAYKQLRERLKTSLSVALVLMLEFS